LRVQKERSIGLLVDAQERLFPFIDGHDRFAAAASRLIRGLQALEVPVMAVQMYTKGLGETVAPLRDLLHGNPPFEKITFSGCDEPALLRALKLSGRRCVIVAGFEAHACVLQTTLGLLAEGFLPVVVEDCVGSQRDADKRVAVERMRQEGARITTSESILFELLEKAGTETFRRVSRIVKEAAQD
jgi:nicotinamidase-related amidase